MVHIKISETPTLKYKRWDRVNNIYGSSILATKNDKNGNPIQLLIMDDIKKRELYLKNAKVVDIIDEKGVQRTYVYKRKGDIIEGEMLLQNNLSDKVKPLIMAAKWVTKDLIPQFVELIINPKHRDSSLYIKSLNSEVSKSTFEHIARVRAENFETIPKITPKKMTFETVTGEKIVSEGSWYDNTAYANYFHITKEPLGNNLMVLV